MVTTRNLHSQYEGQYQAIILKQKEAYEIRAFGHPVELLRDIQKSRSKGYVPLNLFEDVSWKALRDLEKAVEKANNGFEVDFNSVLN